MAKVGNIVIYRPKDGRENELLELVKKHWGVAHKSGLTTDEPARIWRATDKRTGKVSIVERFFWADEESSSRAHHDAGVQTVWGPMDAVLEDMTILAIDEVPGHPPVKKAKASRPKAAPKKAAVKKKPAAKKKAAPAKRKAKAAKPLAKRRAPSARGRGARPTRTARKTTRRR